MLEIIEDLQRQQQPSSSAPTTTTTANTAAAPVARHPAVPPKPVRKLLQNAVNNRGHGTVQVQLPPAPATPPRVARRGRRKLPTPQPPVEVEAETMSSSSSSSNSSQLSGADYHLYEEILYDLCPSMAKTPVEMLPPPLPARPARPNPVATSISVAAAAAAAATASSKPWLNVIRPLRRDRNNQLIRSTSASHCWSNTMTSSNTSGFSKLHHADQISSARSNVYTFGSQPTNNNTNNIKTLSSSSSRLHHHLEDGEYGFRAAMV